MCRLQGLRLRIWCVGFMVYSLRFMIRSKGVGVRVRAVKELKGVGFRV